MGREDAQARVVLRGVSRLTCTRRKGWTARDEHIEGARPSPSLQAKLFCPLSFSRVVIGVLGSPLSAPKRDPLLRLGNHRVGRRSCGEWGSRFDACVGSIATPIHIQNCMMASSASLRTAIVPPFAGCWRTPCREERLQALPEAGERDPAWLAHHAEDPGDRAAAISLCLGGHLPCRVRRVASGGPSSSSRALRFNDAHLTPGRSGRLISRERRSAACE
jgi:hypothetical protein